MAHDTWIGTRATQYILESYRCGVHIFSHNLSLVTSLIHRVIYLTTLPYLQQRIPRTRFEARTSAHTRSSISKYHPPFQKSEGCSYEKVAHYRLFFEHRVSLQKRHGFTVLGNSWIHKFKCGPVALHFFRGSRFGDVSIQTLLRVRCVVTLWRTHVSDRSVSFQQDISAQRIPRTRFKTRPSPLTPFTISWSHPPHPPLQNPEGCSYVPKVLPFEKCPPRRTSGTNNSVEFLRAVLDYC